MRFNHRQIFLTLTILTLTACLGGNKKKGASVSLAQAPELKIESIASGIDSSDESPENIQKASVEIFSQLEKDNKGFRRTKEGVYFKILAGDKTQLETELSEGTQVTFRHRTYLPTGKQIQDTSNEEKALKTRMGYLIPGWKSVLKRHSAGTLFRIIVPSELAYAKAGSVGVPADSALIFDIVVLETENANTSN